MNTIIAVIALTLLVTVVVLLLVIPRLRRSTTHLRAVIESLERPLLFYDSGGRLVFHSAGLILFKKESIEAISRLETKPTGSQVLAGEMIIDFNRYRYRSKSLEYKPDTFGTIVFLEYRGSSAAK